MTFQFDGSADRRIYDAVFALPAAPPLERRDVEAMLGTFADVSRGRDGRVTFTRNGQTLVLPAGGGEHLRDVGELISIRHFLQRAGTRSPGVVTDGARLAVVIDDRAARVYRIRLAGASPCGLTPYDPHGFAEHLRYAANGDCDGRPRRREPECRSFFEAVARTLGAAARVVLVFGIAPGARGAVNQLFGQLRLHHRELAGRVVGTVAVDARNPTDVQVLAALREFYRTRATEAGPPAHSGTGDVPA